MLLIVHRMVFFAEKNKYRGNTSLPLRRSLQVKIALYHLFAVGCSKELFVIRQCLALMHTGVEHLPIS